MLNWLARYAPLRDLLLDDAGRPRTSILDVGCGPHGMACAFPDVPFAGTDVLFPHQVTPSMVGIRSRPGPLPFADGAFGTVLCLDVLEHIPGPDRPGFVAEMTRVAAERVILACPSSEAQAIDDFVRAQAGEPMPLWLAEHYDCGLPTPTEIEACVSRVPGFRARELGTGNGLLSVLVALGDMLPVTAGAARVEYAAHRDQWTELLASATFGPSPRKAWAVERVDARRPLVRADCPRDDVAAALRCPDCGGAHSDLACAGCGRPVALDDTGAWDLASESAVAASEPARAPAALDINAANVLWLRPRWDRPATWVPALHAYVELSGPDSDSCLVLDASDGSDIAEVVAQACADLAGDVPFGDVLLVTEPAVRPHGATDVDGPATVTAALAA
jgi:hypothetical protein